VEKQKGHMGRVQYFYWTSCSKSWRGEGLCMAIKGEGVSEEQGAEPKKEKGRD